MLFDCYLAGATRAPAVSAHVLCTPYDHATVYGVTSFEATYVGHMCLAVTCHPYFRQNDRDL